MTQPTRLSLVGEETKGQIVSSPAPFLVLEAPLFVLEAPRPRPGSPPLRPGGPPSSPWRPRFLALEAPLPRPGGPPYPGGPPLRPGGLPSSPWRPAVCTWAPDRAPRSSTGSPHEAEAECLRDEGPVLCAGPPRDPRRSLGGPTPGVPVAGAHSHPRRRRHPTTCLSVKS